MLDQAKLAIVERQRRRIWGLCYRMTGDSAAADDLAQDSIERAINRGEQSSDDHFEAWLYRVATTTCLDWLRRRKREQAAITLVDPVKLAEAPFAVEASAEARLLRREDVRFALLTSLCTLSPSQRAVLILRDVLDRSTDETAEALGVSSANVKVLLHRARAKLESAHRVGICDAPVDEAVIERFALALEAGDLDGVAKLFADDVWGIVDDGRGRRKPTLGLRAVARQWANAFKRYARVDAIRRIHLNGELALVADVAGRALASVHVETRDGKIASLRVVLDPDRLERLSI